MTKNIKTIRMTCKLTVFILLPCLLLLVKCTPDPELITINDKFNTANYPTTKDQLFSLLVPAYSQLRDAGLYGRNFTVKFQTNMDHTADLAFGGDDNWVQLCKNDLLNTNSNAGDAWTGCYVGVKNVNLFLDRLQFYKDNYVKPGEEANLAHMEGEARFLRALYYFYLESFYGESYISGGQGGDKRGVVISKLTEGLEGTQIPRSTVREIWDYIIADLKASETLLAGHVWPGTQKARVNEWAVKGLLGKVYVFTEDWTNAEAKLKQVISSGKRLMPFAKYKNAFNGDITNEYNEESLFEVNVDRDIDVPTNNNTNLSTLYGLVNAPSFLGDDGTEEKAGALGFGNIFVHDKNLFRFGFNLPIWTLVTNPNFDPKKKASQTNPPKILDPDYRQKSLDLRQNKTVDPRLYVCALQPWIDNVSKDGINYIPVARYKEIPLAIRPQYYGWSFRKYATIDNHLNNYKRNDAANLYVLRLADVYLLYAEAKMKLGDNVTALEYLNKVKRRAYSYPVDAPSPVDYLSLTGATKATDPVLMNNPLRYERWAELFNEGYWWFDVCRWRLGQQEADYYVKTVVGDIQWNNNKSYVMPIPVKEINTNTKVTQNPGY